MGVGLFHSHSENVDCGAPFPPGNPDPGDYEILSSERIGAYVLLEVRYPGARNYGGRKLALYEATPKELASAKRLDPHFSEERGPTVPIARFEPTELGRAIACALVDVLDEDMEGER
jgi:hypothetical protein